MMNKNSDSINKSYLRRKRPALFFFLIFLAVTISSCSLFSKDKKEEEKKPPVETLYNDAMDGVENGKYQDAIEKFEEIERTYPYSKLAIKSKVMTAYAQYKWNKYESAITTIERFVKLHPGNKDVSYAYYLKALCYYEQISDVRRDQGITELAAAALKTLIARFPDSEYAKDARLKLDLVQDHLAGKEMNVGRFYLHQGKFVAAINRFKKVVDKYQTTSHVEEALHRLVESYVSLGIRAEAEKYAAVLGYNFPGGKWYSQSYRLLTGHLPKADIASENNKWLKKIDFSLPGLNLLGGKANKENSTEVEDIEGGN